MIVSRGRSYIFVHIPKTGGTSMALALEDRAMRDDILIGDTPKARRRRGRLSGFKVAGRLWKHATLADIDGLLAPDEMARMFTFTLVRNPWNRVASYYNWLRGQAFDHPAVRIARQTTFRGFLRDPLIRRSLSASPAASYMRDAQGREWCNAYIRLEHFEEDAGPLESHLGFRITLPHANASCGGGALYCEETAAAVAALCAEDTTRFGYRFPPSTPERTGESDSLE